MKTRQQRKANARHFARMITRGELPKNDARAMFQPIMNETHPHGNRHTRRFASAGKNPHVAKGGCPNWRSKAERIGRKFGMPRFLGVVDQFAVMPGGRRTGGGTRMDPKPTLPLAIDLAAKRNRQPKSPRHTGYASGAHPHNS
jgi:hypothetical protein